MEAEAAMRVAQEASMEAERLAAMVEEKVREADKVATMASETAIRAENASNRGHCSKGGSNIRQDGRTL